MATTPLDTINTRRKHSGYNDIGVKHGTKRDWALVLIAGNHICLTRFVLVELSKDTEWGSVVVL